MGETSPRSTTKDRDMLVLTRRVGETLLIGDDIEVVVLGVSGHQVRIGIEAPNSVSILREELTTPRVPETASDHPQTQVGAPTL